MQFHSRFQLSRSVTQKLADLPPGEHIAIREDTFAFSIKAVLLALFGSYFEDDEKAQDIRKSYDKVRDETFSRRVPHWKMPTTQLRCTSIKLGTPM